MATLKNGVLEIDTSIDPRREIDIITPIDSIEVQWSGHYPNLCRGEWIIKINNIRILESKITDDGTETESVLTNNFGTYKEYDTWYFGNDYDVIWGIYADGLPFDEWLLSDKFKKLNKLLNNNNFFLSKENLKLLYDKINSYDWRNNSCGGCI